MVIVMKIQILTKVQFWGFLILLFRRNILINHSSSLVWQCQVDLTTCLINMCLNTLRTPIRAYKVVS